MKKFLTGAAFMALLLSFSGCGSDSSVDGGDTSSDGSSASVTENGESDMITITSPSAGETVSSPFNVSGTTTMDEETDLVLESYGADGVLNSEATWHTDSDGTFDFQ